MFLYWSHGGKCKHNVQPNKLVSDWYIKDFNPQPLKQAHKAGQWTKKWTEIQTKAIIYYQWYFFNLSFTLDYCILLIHPVDAE